MNQIPVIDMSTFGEHPDEDRRIADEIGENARTLSFMSMTGHGVPNSLVADAFDVMRRVFLTDMTEEQRLAYEFPEIGRQVGYTPTRIERSVGQERYNHMRWWHVMDPKCGITNVFPTEVPEFGPTMLNLHAALKGFAAHVLRAVAIHLHRDPEFFVRWIECGTNLLRTIHYPAITEGEDAGPRSGSHKDINIITVLVPATQPGLRVRGPDGAWIDANNPTGTLIVNFGDMMEKHTFGELKSTEHEVCNPGTACDDRFSMPIFIHPDEERILVGAGAYKRRRLREINLMPRLPENEIDYQDIKDT